MEGKRKRERERGKERERERDYQREIFDTWGRSIFLCCSDTSACVGEWRISVEPRLWEWRQTPGVPLLIPLSPSSMIRFPFSSPSPHHP